MSIDIQAYDPDRDRKHCFRIWEEVGWMDLGSDSSRHHAELIIETGRSWVARLDGEAECSVVTAPGTIRHLGDRLPFTGVTAVTTSRIVRHQGLAGRLTAHALAEAVAEGAVIAGLGMFEQGFYNRLGFGTGTYDLSVSFDPDSLKVPIPSRPPRRLTHDDWQIIHSSRLERNEPHGGVSFHAAEITRAKMHEHGGGFGLGFLDDDGRLTHHFWCSTPDAEYGPYYVGWLNYHTGDQFLELMGILRSLGDQVRRVTLFEPAGVQLQDLLDRPIQAALRTRNSRFEAGIRALAFWQLRICDVAAAMAKTHLECPPFAFNLRLSDPVESYLDESYAWRGSAGDYTIEAGPECSARHGIDPALPTLESTVNAFSRLWLGVVPASGLTLTDGVKGPSDLIERLDRAFRLPRPVRDWDF